MTDTTVIEPEVLDEGPSLREELAAALSASSGDTQSQTDAPASQATAAKPDKPAAPALEGPARDEQGRFAPKEGVQAQQTISTEPKPLQAPAAPAEQAQGQVLQTSGPPPSWSAAAKAEFEKLSPVIRQEVLKREADIERGKAQWQQGAEQLNRLNSAIGSRAERWRMAGFSVDQGIGRLVAAEEALERDPVNAIAHLARQFGVDLRTFAQGQGQQQPQPAQLHPALAQAIAREVAPLKDALTQQQQASQQAQQSAIMQHIEAFAADPAHIYLDNVLDPMAALMKARPGMSLQDAYDQATWADPEVRKLLLLKQDEERQAQASEVARAKAAQARHASGSITGSPAPGATPGRGGPAPTLREELASAFAQHAA